MIGSINGLVLYLILRGGEYVFSYRIVELAVVSCIVGPNAPLRLDCPETTKQEIDSINNTICGAHERLSAIHRVRAVKDCH